MHSGDPRPCIITVAITGSVTRKEHNAAVPITVSEQIESTHAAFEAGAALVHVHVRNDDQSPTSNPDKFTEFQDRIYSTGSCNFPTRVYENPPELIQELAEKMRRYGIKPEIEVFDLAMLYNAVAYARDGLLETPLHVQFVLGVKHALPADRDILEFEVAKLGTLMAEATWAAKGKGPRTKDQGPASAECSMRQRFLSLVLTAAIVTGLAACASPTAQTDAEPIHPLDPLSAEEITAATAVLNAAGQMAPSVRVVILETEEPEKARVLEQAAKGQSRRVARALLYDWKDGALTETRVDLQSRTVASTRALGTGDPPVRHVILSRATEIAVADPRVAQALKRRGVPLDRVTFLGGLREGGTLPQRGTARLVTVSPYVWAEVGDAAILPGFSVRVDLTAGVVDDFQEGPIPGVPAASARPGASASSTLKPLRVTSPDGPSFRIRGSEIEWDRWRIHYGMHPRRGIEVFDVGWRDGDRYRSVLYRGSLSELITPYGDPSFGTWYPRDAGDYGMTSYSASRAQAIIGADAPDNAVFRPAAIAGTRGQAITIERAVAIYERDAGILWRHAVEGQRARQLVLSGYSTVDNYDYLFHWIFGQDGAIDVQVQLTGVMNVRPIRTPGEPGRLQFGHMVAPGINAPNHEHFFSWRLDLDVDGNANRVVEMNTAHVPDNVGEWFAMEERILRSEMEGQRDMEFSAARRWLVRNNSRTNALDHPIAYALIPGENAPPFQAPGSAPRRRAPFLDHQLWITRYDRAQMYSSGEFVNLDTSRDNVAAWSGDNQSLMDEDVVLWYTLAVLHLPRPEDWPVMPSHTAGFRLVPAGFFAANPAYDANASGASTGVRPAAR